MLNFIVQDNNNNISYHLSSPISITNKRVGCQQKGRENFLGVAKVKKARIWNLAKGHTQV